MFINHCHVFPEGLIKMFFESQERESYPENFGTIPALKKCMKKLGIEKAVVFALLENLLNTADCFDPNKWLLNNLQREKNLYGFVCISPTREDAAEKLKQYVSLGFVGAKIHPSVQRVQIDDPSAEDFYSAAEELNVPLLFHTGIHDWYLEKYRPILLDKVAQNHPELPIIIEHVGGTAFFYEALAVLQNNPNCYAGIASTLKEDSAWHLPPEWISLLLKTVGAGRIIYGADFPWNDCEQIKFDIETINDLNITSDEKEKILGKNIERLIKSADHI